jgi:hypothetical protein
MTLDIVLYQDCPARCERMSDCQFQGRGKKGDFCGNSARHLPEECCHNPEVPKRTRTPVKNKGFFNEKTKRGQKR